MTSRPWQTLRELLFLPRILPEHSSFSELIENKQITWDWSVNLMGWKSPLLLVMFNYAPDLQ